MHDITVEKLMDALDQFPLHYVVSEREVMALTVYPPGARFDENGEYLEGCKPVRLFKYVEIGNPSSK
jgi:hypothetical protein